MKLLGALLLALVAIASADEQFYNNQNYQNYDNYNYQAPSNYYREPSILDRLTAVFQGNRRTFGYEPVVVIVVIGACVVGVFVIGGIMSALLDKNSSGRGLDTDQWEVDHSVWMDQLQRDFEDSWHTE